MLPFALTVEEVAGLREQDHSFLLLDVREPDEVATTKIDGSVHIPMGEIPARASVGLPDKAQHIVAYCHHGMRSARVVEYLRQQGYTQVQNMIGGIDEWSVKVDSDVARY